MGANEKFNAAMHGYVPDIGQIRDAWVDSKIYHLPKSTRTALVPTVQAEFDRWLATVKAQALTDLADQMRDRFTASWIRGKARELTHGPRKITGAFAVTESEADCGDNDL